MDDDRLSNAATEIQKAIDKVSPEIIIKFYRQSPLKKVPSRRAIKRAAANEAIGNTYGAY